MAKHTVTMSSGEKIEVGGKRNYTHAVLGAFKAGEAEQIISLCGSLALAEKKLAALNAGKKFLPIVGGKIAPVVDEQPAQANNIRLQRELGKLLFG